MREKLLDLMKSEGLKPSQLAEMLEINPAGVSHILAGRNKPGFDLLQKILRRFPQINPDWLLLDSTKMYRDDNTVAGSQDARSSQLGNDNAKEVLSAGGLFNQTRSQQSLSSTQQTHHIGEHAENAVPGILPDNRATSLNQGGKATTGPAVERVVIFYEDQTFESFTTRQGTKAL